MNLEDDDYEEDEMPRDEMGEIIIDDEDEPEHFKAFWCVKLGLIENYKYLYKVALQI